MLNVSHNKIKEKFLVDSMIMYIDRELAEDINSDLCSVCLQKSGFFLKSEFRGK